MQPARVRALPCGEPARKSEPEARALLFLAVGLPALCFVLLTVAVRLRHTRWLDLRALHAAARLRGAPFSTVVVGHGGYVQIHPGGRFAALDALLGHVGDPAVASVCVLALAMWALRSSPRRAAALPLAFAGAVAVELALKHLVYHPEPGSVTSIYPYAVRSSYPSGHTLVAGFLAASVTLLSSRKTVAAAALVFVGLVACSRLFTGDHWLSDVAGGALLGWLAGAVVLASSARAPLLLRLG